MSTAITQRTSLTLPIEGERVTGQDVRNQNVIAVQSIANIIKSSLGPVGLDKMLVDDIGDVTISNDGATILALLEVEHPAAKMLVELAQQQDKEVGDGTTSVVILAAELLKQANELVKLKIHPTTIISGYRLALKESCRYIVDHLAMKADTLGRECLINCAKTCLSSKVLGSGGLDTTLSDFFAQMAVDAILMTKIGGKNLFSSTQATSTQSGQSSSIKCPISSVHILKAHGKSQLSSQLIKGFALNCTLASPAMVKTITKAKIACLDMNLQKVRMPLGVHIVVDDPNQLEAIRKRESDITCERIRKILQSGANVILTTKGIDDMSLKVFIDAGAMAVRRCNKEDLKKIAKATGATLVSTLANLEGEETFDASLLGEAEEVSQTRISDDECILINDPKLAGVASIILRGANDYMLDEMERSIHDALCVIKRTLESNLVVPGGGAVEAGLSIYLENLSTTFSSKEQMAIAKFAEAMLIIPKTLAVNAAKDATELVARLTSVHYARGQQTSINGTPDDLKWSGLDLINGRVRNNLQAGVLEPCMVKLKSLKAATEAAISILRIDDMIKVSSPARREDA